MTPAQEHKLDSLISDVAAIKSAIGGDKRLGTKGIQDRLNEHHGRFEAIDTVIQTYKEERARIVGVAVSSSAIFVAIGSFVMWLIGFLKGN